MFSKNKSNNKTSLIITFEKLTFEKVSQNLFQLQWKLKKLHGVSDKQLVSQQNDILFHKSFPISITFKKKNKNHVTITILEYINNKKKEIAAGKTEISDDSHHSEIQFQTKLLGNLKLTYSIRPGGDLPVIDSQSSEVDPITVSESSILSNTEFTPRNPTPVKSRSQGGLCHSNTNPNHLARFSTRIRPKSFYVNDPVLQRLNRTTTIASIDAYFETKSPIQKSSSNYSLFDSEIDNFDFIPQNPELIEEILTRKFTNSSFSYSKWDRVQAMFFLIFHNYSRNSELYERIFKNKEFPSNYVDMFVVLVYLKAGFKYDSRNDVHTFLNKYIELYQMEIIKEFSQIFQIICKELLEADEGELLFGNISLLKESALKNTEPFEDFFRTLINYSLDYAFCYAYYSKKSVSFSDSMQIKRLVENCKSILNVDVECFLQIANFIQTAYSITTQPQIFKEICSNLAPILVSSFLHNYTTDDMCPDKINPFPFDTYFGLTSSSFNLDFSVLSIDDLLEKIDPDGWRNVKFASADFQNFPFISYFYQTSNN